MTAESSSTLLRSLNDSFLENWAGVSSVAKLVGLSSSDNWLSICCWPSQELFAVIVILKYIFQDQKCCIQFDYCCQTDICYAVLDHENIPNNLA